MPLLFFFLFPNLWSYSEQSLLDVYEASS